MAISKSTRESVYSKFGGHCAYCGEEIRYKDMQVDHVVPKLNWDVWWANKKNEFPLFIRHLGKGDVNHLDNLFPSCRECNKSKDTFSINVFRHQMEAQLTRAILYSRNYRMAKKFKQVIERPVPIVFYFESINDKKSCTTCGGSGREEIGSGGGIDIECNVCHGSGSV